MRKIYFKKEREAGGFSCVSLILFYERKENELG